MIASKATMLWGGVAVVVATHVWILANGMPAKDVPVHSMLNLAAAGAIALSSGA